MMFVFALFSSFLLAAILVLLDFFPARSLFAENILMYFIYQQGNILSFDIEKKVFMTIIAASLAVFVIFYIVLPLFFKPPTRALAKKAVAFLLFFFAVLKVETTVRLTRAVMGSLTPGRLFETSFKEPSYVPPERKKNLIFIFMESIENAYRSETVSGRNLIPYLSADGGTVFSDYLEIRGADTTSSSMIAALCGLPNIPSLETLVRNRHDFMFSGNACVTDILDKEGYATFFYTSGDAKYANKDAFMTAHHVRRIKDGPAMRTGHGDEGVTFFDGVKDSVMFKNAVEDIKKAGRENPPFAFFILTLDTHEPDGFLDPECARSPDGKRDAAAEFKDVVSCSDAQIRKFVAALENEPFFKDTLIVLAGDHLARTNGLSPMLETLRHRTVYNKFINMTPPPADPNRTFTSLDLAPTVLEALGFRLKDGAFGLGRSLLRPAPTLIEEHGKEGLERELLKKSKKYNGFLKK